jgi:phage baseplate assembly protein W
MTVADDLHLGTDVRLALAHQSWRPEYRPATVRRRVPGEAARPAAGAPRDDLGRAFAEVLRRRSGPSRRDLATVAGRDNLEQAVALRLLTPAGELAPLGHPDYGSRLPDLVGRQNTPTTRNLVRLAILDSLARERRIAEVLAVRVEPLAGRRQAVAVDVEVLPAAGGGPLSIPFTLELAP